MVRKIHFRGSGALLLIACCLAGCALQPGWRWDRPGATDGDYDADLIYCKGQSYSGVDGMVTSQMVRRMHTCMEGRGWRKVDK